MAESFTEFPNVEARDAAWIARATSFTAFMLVGGYRFREDFPDLAGAASCARDYETICARYGLTAKRALVYAITAEGHAAMVSRADWLNALEALR